MYLLLFNQIYVNAIINRLSNNVRKNLTKGYGGFKNFFF